MSEYVHFNTREMLTIKLLLNYSLFSERMHVFNPVVPVI